jgi:hypothetical protein
MDFKKKFNGYLGFDPVSLFVNLIGFYALSGLEQTYKDIASYKVRDIIFEGDLPKNIEYLSWLTTKLIADEFFVSVVFSMKELEVLGKVEVTAQRTILLIDQLFKGWSKILVTLGQADLILVKTDSIAVLETVIAQMSQNNCFASLYFDATMLEKFKVLGSGVTTAYPYEGE